MRDFQTQYAHIPVFAERDRRHIRRTAFHEAGHAVTALAVHRGFAAVTVSSTQWLLGRVQGLKIGLPTESLQHSPFGRCIIVSQEWASMLIALAGPVAEWMKMRSVRESSGDLLQAAQHLQAIRPTLDQSAALRLAQRQRRHVREVLHAAWPAEDLLAEALMEEGTISYQNAEALFWRELPDGVPFSLLRCPLPEAQAANASIAQLDRAPGL
jgi:hypothetical protein